MRHLVIASLVWGLLVACRARVEGPRAEAKGGAELWSENCARCHHMRPIDSYAPEQWGLIMIHMRVRSNITGEEYRAIRAFLQGGR